MEIIEEEDEEIKELMLKISDKEITICETCDSVFDYLTNKKFCDKCREKKLHERRQAPGEKERLREYQRRPEQREKARIRKQSSEYKEQQRLYRQQPEVRARKNARYHQQKLRGKR